MYANFCRFYTGYNHELINHMPISLFFKYLEVMSDYIGELEKTKFEKDVDKLKKYDLTDEIREARENARSKTGTDLNGWY